MLPAEPCTRSQHLRTADRLTLQKVHGIPGRLPTRHLGRHDWVVTARRFSVAKGDHPVQRNREV